MVCWDSRGRRNVKQLKVDTGHYYTPTSCKLCGKALLVRNKNLRIEGNYCRKCVRKVYKVRSSVREICPRCKSDRVRKDSKDKGRQRYYCNGCNRTFIKQEELKIGGLNRSEVKVRCAKCKGINVHKHGFYKERQLYYCWDCHATKMILYKQE